jgi:hypothetical protein
MHGQIWFPERFSEKFILLRQQPDDERISTRNDGNFTDKVRLGNVPSVSLVPQRIARWYVCVYEALRMAEPG